MSPFGETDEDSFGTARRAVVSVVIHVLIFFWAISFEKAHEFNIFLDILAKKRKKTKVSH